MLNTNESLPSSQALAREIIERVDAFRQDVRISTTGIEKAAGVGHGTLHRLRRIADGDAGSFSYETAERVHAWLTSEDAAALRAEKKTTERTADA